MEKRVLVLGGTGAMGVYLVPELLRMGCKVDVTSRSEQKSYDENLNFVRGDAHDNEFLKKLLGKRYDAIVDFMVYGTEEFRGRYELLLNNTDQLIYLSSVTALSDKPFPLSEKTPRLYDSLPKDNVFRNSDEYAIAKARQENILRESGRKNWTIVRPSITYSKERLQLVNLEIDTLMFRAMQGLPVVLPREAMDKQTTMTWGGDVAKMMARLIGNPKALGEDFNLATAEHHTWREVAEYYKGLIGLKYKEVDLETFLKCVGGENQMKYHRLFDLVYDNSKILKATGLKQDEFRRLKDGLSEETQYFQKHPRYFRPEFMYEMNANMDRALGTKIDLTGATSRQKDIYEQYYKMYPFKGKRILITQPLAKTLVGSTMVTLELADYLQWMGMDVTVYTCVYGYPAQEFFERRGIKVVSAETEPELSLNDYDFVWVHSQILPISIVRELGNMREIKTMPSFIFLHMSAVDWIPDEKPWIYEFEQKLSSKSLYIAEEILEANDGFLTKSVDTGYFRNPAPEGFAKFEKERSEKLKKLLVVSNHPPQELLEAREILAEKGVEVVFMGYGQEKYTMFTPEILRDVDAVVTIAKSVQYCLTSGTPVYIYDNFGGPGWLNVRNYEKVRWCNYSGRGFAKKTAEKIAKELVDGYAAALKYQAKNRDEFKNELTISHVIPDILSSVKPRKIQEFRQDYMKMAEAAEKIATYYFQSLVRDHDAAVRIKGLEKELQATKTELAEANRVKDRFIDDFDKVMKSKAWKVGKGLMLPGHLAKEFLKKLSK